VHKIACNHLISVDTEMAPMAGSDTAVSYFTMDYAEEEAKMEKLAFRFKLEETLNNFKKVFKECQEELKKNDQQGNVDHEQSPVVKEDSKEKPEVNGEDVHEKVEESNKKVEESNEKVEESNKKGEESNKKEAPKPAETSAQGSIFGNNTSGNLFGQASASPSIFGGNTPNTSGSIFGQSNNTPKDGSSSIFGTPKSNETEKTAGGSIFGI